MTWCLWRLWKVVEDESDGSEGSLLISVYYAAEHYCNTLDRLSFKTSPWCPNHATSRNSWGQRLKFGECSLVQNVSSVNLPKSSSTTKIDQIRAVRQKFTRLKEHHFLECLWDLNFDYIQTLHEIEVTLALYIYLYIYYTHYMYIITYAYGIYIYIHTLKFVYVCPTYIKHVNICLSTHTDIQTDH